MIDASQTTINNELRSVGVCAIYVPLKRSMAYEHHTRFVAIIGESNSWQEKEVFIKK